MKSLNNYYFKYYKEIIAALVFLVLEALCELQLPGYIAKIITDGVVLSNMDAIKEHGGYMMLYTLGSVLCSIIVGFFSSRVAAFVVRDIRKDLYKKIINFSHSKYEKYELASLITRCTNDLTQVQILTEGLLRLSMLVPVMAIGGTIKAIDYSSSLQSVENVMIFGILAVFVIMILGLVIVMPKTKLMQKQIDKINIITSDALLGMMDIRALNQEEYEKDRFKEASDDFKKTSIFVNRIMQVLVPAMTTIMYVLSIIVLVIIARVVENIAVIANMMAFIQYVMHVIMSFTLVAYLLFIMPRALVSIKRVKEVLKEDENVDEGINEEILNGDIEFQNVSFDFDKQGQNALNNVNFSIKEGEVCAIVGATGAGKSSVIRLLTKLIKKDSGKIYIGNKEIDSISEKIIRKEISCVMQRGFLFEGSIKSNVAYSDNDMKLDDIKKALNISSASEFVSNLEGYIDATVKQDGSNLSGGQKQRLNIARAVAKEAKIYIFDDSFSALDFKTDLKVRQDINEYLKGKTIIIVAQRISSIKHADKIIVLNKGEVVDIGTHDALIERCPIYMDIASSQLEDDNE